MWLVLPPRAALGGALRDVVSVSLREKEDGAGLCRNQAGGLRAGMHCAFCAGCARHAVGSVQCKSWHLLPDHLTVAMSGLALVLVVAGRF